MQTETKTNFELTPAAMERGRRMCRDSVKYCLSEYTWIANNLPSERKADLVAVMNHLVKSLDYLDLESANGLPLDVWCEFRDELGDAFTGTYASVDLMPLVAAAKRHEIPKQYFFDLVDGVDFWIRNRSFSKYDDLLSFAYRIGGTAMLMAVPICGVIKSGYETFAIKAGQSVFLTQILANLVNDVKLNKIFIPEEDLRDTEVSISRIKVRKSTEELKYLVRLYGSRIEKLMHEGGKLIQFLDFDARRTFTSLLAIHWQMLMKMRLDPAIVMNPDGVLTRREWFALKTRHLLGIEGGIPVIPQLNEHH